MANIVRVGVVNDPNSDRFQVVAEWSDGTQGPALGSFQTIEQAFAGAITMWTPYVQLETVEDWTDGDGEGNE